MNPSETAEPQAISGMTSFRRLMAGLRARQDWERQHDAHPLCACHGHTLTQAWREAMLEDHHRTEAREREAALQRANVDLPLRLREAGVPNIHVAGLSRLEERTTLEAARKYLGQPLPRRHPFLVLMGPTATGKTQAAAYVVADFLRRYPWGEAATGQEKRAPALFIRASELNEVDAFGEQGREWLRQLREARLLVIDDVGTERLNDVVISNLYGVVDARYGAMRPTVITSNLKAEQWKTRYDERFGRRIRELGIVVTGSRIHAGGEP